VNQTPILGKLKYVLLGGFFFWAPSVLLHWFRGHKFSGLDVLAVTVLLPFTTVLLFGAVPKTTVFEVPENHKQAALSALLGIWLLGPLMMSLGWSSSGGGFSGSGGWLFVTLGTAAFPVFTFIMSTYDGTLAALSITTAALVFLSKVRAPDRVAQTR